METLFENNELKVLYRSGIGPVCWVTFGAAEGDGAFAEPFITKRNEAAAFIIPKRVHFYQCEGMFLALKAIDGALPSKGRVAYGSSMGGFAALAFRRELRPKLVIAASPLVSVHPKIVGNFDSRWDAFNEGLTYVRKDARTWGPGRVILLQDPCHPIDRIHAAKITAHRRIKIPFAGHALLYALREAGVLEDCIADIVAGGDARTQLQTILSARRRLMHIKLARAEHNHAKGRLMAALELYERAAPIDPARINFQRSRCFQGLGDHVAAAEAAELAATFNPGFSEHARQLRMAA
jgi:hypothetical protein